MGYDQKTVFYFVRRLIEAGLVAKFQAHETGTTSNLLLHRRYWASNETYVAQRTVAAEAENTAQFSAGHGRGQTDNHDSADADVDATSDEPRAQADDDTQGDLADDDEDDDADAVADADAAASAPAPATRLAYPLMPRQRFLAFMNNASLVRTRLFKLIFASDNHIVPKTRLYERMGFPAATRGDRKFFLETVRRAVSRGFVEPVQVELDSGKLLPCLRLTHAGVAETQSIVAAPDNARSAQLQSHLESQLAHTEPRYQRNVTFERQLLEAVKAHGEHGATINELAAGALHTSHKAKRHVDEFMRSCEVASASNTPDYAIFSVIEMAGRERRVRFWTRAGILKGGQEALTSQLSTLHDYDAARLCEGPLMPDERRYTSLRGVGEALAAAAVPANSNTSSTSSSALKRQAANEKARARKVYTNPVDPVTGLPRKGRPRKSDGAPPSAKALAKKRKAGGGEGGGEEEADAQATVPTPKRARQGVAAEGAVTEATAAAAATASSSSSSSTPRRVKRRLSEAAAAGDTPVDVPGTPVDGTPAAGTPAVDTPAAGTSAADTPVAGTPLADPPSADPSSSDSPAKRPRPRPRSSRAPAARIEFSAERRMTCFLEMLDAYSGMLEDSYCGRAFEQFILPRQGDAIEAFLKEVGDLREKKTRTRVIAELEKRGKVKITTTMAPRKSSGRGLQRRVIYRPDVPQADLAGFLRSINEGRELIAPSDTGATTKSIALGPNIGQIELDPRHANANDVIGVIKTRPLRELLDDPAARALFAEVPVVRSQLYGLIPGSLARMQYIHSLILTHIGEHPDGTGGVVSQSAGVFSVDWLVDDVPLEVYVKYRAVVTEAPELLAALQDDTLKALPVSQQSYQIRSTLDHASEIRSRQYLDTHYFQQMVALGIAVPVELNDDSGEYTPTARRADWHSVYRFKIDKLSGEINPLAAFPAVNFTIETPQDVKRFWKAMQADRTLYADRANKASLNVSAPWLKLALRRMANALSIASSWFSHFQLVRRQQIFLTRFVQEETAAILDDAEALQKISKVSLVPTWVVERFMRKSLPRGQRQRHGESGSALKRRAGAVASGEEDKPQRPVRTPRKSRAVEREGEGEDLAASPAPPKTTPSDPSAAITPETVANKITTERQRRRALWRLEIEQIALRAGAEGLAKLRLEEALSEIRDDYIEGKSSAVSLDMLSDMVSAIVAQDGQMPVYDATTAAEQRAGSRKARRSAAAAAAAATDGGIRRRRKRTEVTWTREKDEMLRDACVILTARDRARSVGRSNWIALNQIFGDVNPQQLRQRFAKLASAVGEEAYLAQLQVEWTELWETYRGTALLPDKDYRKPDNFDLETHINFLRQYIDKNKVLEKVENSAAGESLPFDVADLSGEWVLRDSAPSVQAQLDLVHSQDLTLTTLAREQALANTRCVVAQSERSSGTSDDVDPAQARTLGGLIMTLNTPTENFSEEGAMQFCEGLGTDAVEHAVRRLLETRVIKMENREGRRVPGRNFLYTDEHRKALEPAFNIGDLSREAQQSHRDILRKFDGGEAVHVGFDNAVGDTVVLAHMLVEGSVDAVIDVDQLALLTEEVMFNAKSAMDSDIEVGIRMERGERQGGRGDATATAAAAVTLRPVVCEMTIEDDAIKFEQQVQNAWTSASKSRTKGVTASGLAQLQKELREAGAKGIAVRRAIEIAGSRAALDKVCKEGPGGGATAPRAAFIVSSLQHVVHGLFWRDWTVRVVSKTATTSSSSSRWVLPRAWLDIQGTVLEGEWRACVAQVLSHILTRPGIPLAHLLELIGAAWSRGEVSDVLGALQGVGIVTQRVVHGNKVAAAEAAADGGDDDGLVALYGDARALTRLAM